LSDEFLAATISFQFGDARISFAADAFCVLFDLTFSSGVEGCVR
jgi:hypothetical protein